MKSKTIKKDKIKAIIFDMVGVLLFTKKGFSPKTVDEINASNIEKLYNHTDDNKLLVDIENQLKLDNNHLEKALEYIPKKFEKFDQLWQILPELRAKYDLAVVNNGNALAMEHWNNLFDFSIFKFFINSAQEGIKKPDPKIYLLTCKKLGVSPSECIFMDDSFENIKSAKDLGITTIWWDKSKSKEKNLEQFLELIKD